MKTMDFGKTSKGEVVRKYVIGNADGMYAIVTDFGATVVSLFVRDRDGELRDVVLGYDDVASYEREGTFFGATVGPNANRIAGAQFELDGVVYKLDANDNENNLHSGPNTLAKKLWTVKEYTDNKITFSYHGKHLEQGFPGNCDYDVTYEVTAQDELAISYHAVSDRKTIFNMTNHSYFNLNGCDSGNVYTQELCLNADYYTPVKDSKSIPTGEFTTIDRTAFDFFVPKPIGRDIEEQYEEQLEYGHGYDHNFVIDKLEDGVEMIAQAYAPESGIVMEVYTDCPGVQLYTANFIEGQMGKNGHRYENRDGFCLETQYFPNAINEPEFESPITEANVPYESKTIYGFRLKK